MKIWWRNIKEICREEEEKEILMKWEGRFGYGEERVKSVGISRTF